MVSASNAVRVDEGHSFRVDHTFRKSKILGDALRIIRDHQDASLQDIALLSDGALLADEVREIENGKFLLTDQRTTRYLKVMGCATPEEAVGKAAVLLFSYGADVALGLGQVSVNNNHHLLENRHSLELPSISEMVTYIARLKRINKGDLAKAMGISRVTEYQRRSTHINGATVERLPVYREEELIRFARAYCEMPADAHNPHMYIAQTYTGLAQSLLHGTPQTPDL